MRSKSHQRGVSLIEVLMAVLIFSIGLIGLAGLLVISTRSNHSAYLRTQATFLANNMADRMRANPIGVWNNSYNSNGYPILGTTDCETTACTPANIAVRDQQTWSRLLKTLLPNATASITCTALGALSHTVTADELTRRPPYGGTCAMTITWSERDSGDAAHSDAAPKTFSWEFQP